MRQLDLILLVDCRRGSAHYGAPLLGQSLVAGRVAPALEKVVVDGLALSRRDASVTREQHAIGLRGYDTSR